ncbi:MAG TPA: iron-siderophore ABC transporter substrate-binding protein [Micromonosporaceae bacterium]|nr:iron-siderophore ABC transporter substrate-binding protein [Micromonosporaceae bacterium]HCU51470.1 iron-siderophore ABC transporter substrate-binding protein [Micromonosporaceae bacterium]
MPSLRLAAVAAALAFAATGCATAQEAPPQAATTRTVTDATGTQVAVPTQPKRVIALSEQDLDGALALGVKPVGTVNGRGQKTPPAYLNSQITGIAVVGDVAKPTMDKVIAANPDLILAGSVTDAQILTQLRQVAPTVVTYQPADDWMKALRNLGDALGKTDAVTQWFTTYEAKLAEAKGKLGSNSSAKVSLVRWNPQGPGVMQTEHFASLVTKDLGLTRPAAQNEKGFAHTAPLSLEQLSIVDGDVIFVGTLNAEGETALAKVKEVPAFQQLEAVKKNRVVIVDGTVWTSRGGPLAALQVVDDVVKALKA